MAEERMVHLIREAGKIRSSATLLQRDPRVRSRVGGRDPRSAAPDSPAVASGAS